MSIISTKGLKTMLYLILLLIGSGILFMACSPQMGAIRRSTQEQSSTNFSGGKFHNSIQLNTSINKSSMVGATIEFFRGHPDRTPSTPLPTIAPNISTPTTTSDDSELSVTWLGHSTCLIQINGQTILTDPMFSDRASPFSFLGPKKFTYAPAIEFANLPKIDAVLISHDHYDHLDYKTILMLKEKTKRFYVPTGVGDHLRRWGVENTKITELSWWEQSNTETLTFTATPAYHFSGRSLTDRNKTLWASWVIQGHTHRVFFGGDSGYFPGFKTIGEKYGPFDITMLESGAYNEAWADIHMMPEQTVQAHLDLQGKVLLPIHWGKFNLSLHPWQEPITRLTKRAKIKDIQIVTPRIGESFISGKDFPDSQWWKQTT